MHRIFAPLAFLVFAATYTPISCAQSMTAAARMVSITLPQALAQALADNPELASAAHALEANEALAEQAGAWLNPELSYLREDRQRATRTTTWQLNQPLEWGGKRSARIDAAERTRDMAEAQWQARRADVRAEVTTAFFEVLIAQDRVTLAEASLQLAGHATQATSKRVTAGKVSPVEETKARVAEAGVRGELAQARSALVNARQWLANSMGQATPGFERVENGAGLLPDVPVLTALQAQQGTAPLLRTAQLEVARRQALLDLERARRIPDLTLSIGTKRDEQLGRSQAMVGLSVPLPLFDRNGGNVRAALQSQAQARDDLRATQLRLGSELIQTHERLGSARALAEALQNEVLPGAQSAYEAAAKGFELGKFNYLETLDAQRTLFQARAQYFSAVTAAWTARAELDRILGASDSSLFKSQVGSAATGVDKRTGGASSP
jgi:cobalt-zinc-cadmium efflux system outer membrane protein